MKIYLVFDNDRHIDTYATPFKDKEKAIQYAKDMANESCTHKEDFKEHSTVGNDWLYHATYSCEGDHVWVTEVELEE